MSPAMRIRDLLDAAGLPRLEARMLLEHVLGQPRAWLLAHDTDLAPPHVQAAYMALVQRRRAGEPMAYLVGEREFMGHRFRVTSAVLIPRPDTELLVETAVALLQGRPGARVLDLGTGSGIIAVSIALACPHVHVTATDRSADALALARDNARILGANVHFYQGDWYEALPAGERYDVIVSNPPYIASGDVHLTEGDLRFEPRGALTDGGNGLADLASIVVGAVCRLDPGGQLWLEHGWDQAEIVRDMLAQADFDDVLSHTDLAGIERISGGKL
ncbi:peptide chain release factor N(5)-glutamine methyltransferase [Bordetella sp. FB-8]|uniref:peptide chain release factor N(5)-glutamine methyltransferase n=1 Tax=Bordetella sp. FB-8 TaxID=1159870 RepID=UPI000684514D|nr:peptide chain release factor N(5)-glutamine methyltransferase [Bordetella sp. FB-8]